MGVKASAQTTELPPKFYTLQTADEQVQYLRKIIKDSSKAAAFKNVPDYVRKALSLVPKLTTDTVSPWLYQNLADAYAENKIDSALYYYRISFYTWKNISDAKKMYLLQSLLDLSAVQSQQDSTRRYISMLQSVIKDLPDINHKKLLIVNSIAKAYESLNQYEQAIINYRFIIKNSFIAKDSMSLRNGFVNAGNAYNETGNDRMAVYFTMQAIQYLQNDEFASMVTFTNLGSYFATLKKLDSATIFFDKAAAIADKSGDESAINTVGLQRANVLVSQGKFSEAELLLKKAFSFYEKISPDVDIVNCLLTYAGLDTSRHDYVAAKNHLLRLNDITKNGLKAYHRQTLEFLTTVYVELGDYKNAFKSQSAFIVINDSIRSDKVQQSFATLQTEYETYKKEEQIKALQSDAKIKALELKTARRNKALYLLGGLLLVFLFCGLWYLRNLRNKTALSQLKAELEMKALRSQMNPHFIFNSLNSIQKYIWQNKTEDAAEYLTKFARLIRLVLENSQHGMIPLSDELDALRLYVEMEHRRNNAKFDYSITVSEDITPEEMMIPPLLLQPYVENAIWHGLSEKEERGKLLVHIQKAVDNIVCNVEDDGVGRAYAAVHSQRKGKKSMALNISAQRLEWLGKDKGRKASIEIIDKINNGVAAGTTVTIYIPIIKSK